MYSFLKLPKDIKLFHRSYVHTPGSNEIEPIDLTKRQEKRH